MLWLALGLGLLAKHAMLLWLAGSFAAAFFVPTFRPARSDALLALIVMLAVVAPHLVWLQRHGFITLLHVQSITEGKAASVLRRCGF